MGPHSLPNLYFDRLKTVPSVCYGETNNGYVSGAKLVTPKGARNYCWICKQALRTYAHQPVAETIEEAYAALHSVGMKNDFVLGEVGFPWGGRLRPHKTHRNGLSVDFMVPLKDGVRLPTHALNKFGYNLEFDRDGKIDAGEIDFLAISVHLNTLDIAARKRGGKIRRIFFAPDLQKHLVPDLRSKFRFNKKQSWVRHDDHYHVDFEFPCKKMGA